MGQFYHVDIYCQGIGGFKKMIGMTETQAFLVFGLGSVT
jgi:hypothetical protein